MAGSKGGLNVLRFAHGGIPRATSDAPAVGSPWDNLKLGDSQTYQVDVKPGDTLVCAISATRDLLFVLLPREVRMKEGLH